MTPIRHTSLGAFAVVLTLAGLHFVRDSAAFAASVFLQTTSEHFEEGEAKGTIVAPPGQVEPGFEAQRHDVDAGFVWASALSPDGKTAFFGTGDPGRVYALPTSGGNARLVVELPEPWVTALAVESADTLLVATTPGAKIYRVGVRDGKTSVLAKLDGAHVWALVHDPQGKRTYAGVGGPGKVVVIEARGQAKTLWDAQDQHVIAMIPDGRGAVLVGSAEKAILFRVTAEGEARALHDFEADEVRAVAKVGKDIYVAVNRFEGGEPEPVAKDKSAKGTPLVTGGKSPAAPGTLPRPGAPKGKGAVYRLEPSGAIEEILSLDTGYFTALLAGEKGHVFAAAGTEGKVYRVDAEGNGVLMLDVPERQALTLVPHAQGLWVGTGDGAALFRAVPASPKSALYLSKVFDASRPAQWGHLRYGASMALPVETRSGNTARPDDTWESWTALASASFDASEGEGRMASAPGRYLQYRTSLPPGAVLRDIALYHQPQNTRPRVTELSLADAEPKASDVREHASLLKLRWKVENPDADQLAYELAYKREEDQAWRPLGPVEAPLTKAEYDWNTESVPDGRFVVRVEVTDAPSVAQDRVLSSTFVSPPLLVDNARPAVTGLHARLPTITGEASDAASPLTHIEFSVDGGPWQAVSPNDGLLDRRKEAFSFRVPHLTRGAHVVAVRAYDAANNLGVAELVVELQ